MPRNPPIRHNGKPKSPGSKPHEEKKLDEEIEDSFPASDPPSYAGGKHRSGAPQNPRERKDRH